MPQPVVTASPRYNPELDNLDELRLRCAELFDALPEPPVYRRADAPARGQLAGLLPRIEKLRAELAGAGSGSGVAEERRNLDGALAAMAETLGLLGGDQYSAAEEAWLSFKALKIKALSTRKLWILSEEDALPAVFDRSTGSSRFDPRPELKSSVQLVCSNPSCGKSGVYGASRTGGRQTFECPHCHERFFGYLAEVKEVHVQIKSLDRRQYGFRLAEMGGAQTRVQFEEGASQPFRIARGDYLALIYSPRSDLRAALNLNTGRLLWVKRAGSCFIASAVFGAAAPELIPFQRFRDQYLERRVLGRLFVRIYYAAGPSLAKMIQLLRLTRFVRHLLVRVETLLRHRGYR